MNISSTIHAVLFTILSLFILTPTNAQTLGANRSAIKWKVIKTPAANIIFAPELSKKAYKVADIINYMKENNSLSIGPHEHKIDILIRNETIVPNGYVALGPYRSEFFATPPDRFNRIGATDWLEHLTIHEFRHVQQTANEKVGLTKWIYYLTGQSGWNGMKFLAIPQWVSEGDAVVMETTLTLSGRGRMPYFTRGLRALALENNNYNYHKWRNGSYDELIPDQYPFGYMLLSHLRNTHGSKTSGDIIREGAAYERIFYPYSSALKGKTQWSTTDLYKEAWLHFGDQWRDEVKNLDLTKTRKIRKDPSVVTNYYFPQFDENKQIVALKGSFNQTEHLIQLFGPTDSLITHVGFSYSDYFHYKNGLFAWTEYNQNGRRTNTQYSNIFTYNRITSKKQKLTSKGKYFSPSISSNGKKIVAIHIDTNSKNEVHILDSNSGKIVKTLPIEGGASITRSIFLNEDQSIAYIIKNQNYIWIESMDMATGKTTRLTPKSSHVIDAISCYGNHIYYSASYTGIDNIFKVKIDGSKDIQQVTSVPIGAYEPSVSQDGKTLIFTEYTVDGQMISIMNLTDAVKRTSISITEPVDMDWLDKVSDIEEGGEILTQLGEEKTYETEEYKGLFKGLKLHSWAFNPNSADIVGGLQFNNILDDFSIFAGGGFNLNERRGYYQLSTKVAKYFPIYEFRAESRGRSTVRLMESDTFALQRFEEYNFSTDVSIPLTWVSGNYFKNISFGAGLNYRLLDDVFAGDVDLGNSSITTVDFFIRMSSLRRRAYQNVRSRWGISFLGRYATNISDTRAGRLLGTSRFFLPGLDYNHSFSLTTSYQHELLRNPYQLSDSFGYPRGYRAPINDSAFKFGMDYMFPIAYPDVGLFGIAYLKRMRMNLFYDIGQFKINDADFKDNFQSIGADMYFDLVYYHLLPTSLIVRYSYRLTENVFDDVGGRLEIFYSINF